MATEQVVPERPTPDWHVEPRPCVCCHVDSLGNDGLTDCERRWYLERFRNGVGSRTRLPQPLRWDGDDT